MKMKKPVTDKLSRRTEPAVRRDSAAATLGCNASVRDAKAHLSALLEWVASGPELTITSDGQPKARLVSVAASKPRRVFAGMGDFLLRQRVHGGPSTDELIRAERKARP